jgi:hypothetical protein
MSQASPSSPPPAAGSSAGKNKKNIVNQQSSTSYDLTALKSKTRKDFFSSALPVLFKPMLQASPANQVLCPS